MKHIEILSAIQADLNAPKGQTNKFGGYTYRSCEDILEALKPLLAEHRAAVTLTDELNVPSTGHIYIQSRATLHTTEGEIHCEALAREPMDAKGMSPAQCTGAASSYARKYALNGLFCIDDNKDADATNTHDEEEKPDRLLEAEKPKKTRFAKQSVGDKEQEARDNWHEANRALEEKAESWKEFVVPFGKNKDVRLGDLKEASLDWYIENIDDKHAGFRKALDAAGEDKESAGRDAMAPDAVDKLPFEGDENELPF